ncbi:MAG: hypothetical protein AAF585_02710 [Verrucomicrobiota bacterium]
MTQTFEPTPLYLIIGATLFGLLLQLLAFSMLEHGFGAEAKMLSIFCRNLAASLVVMMVYAFLCFDLMYPGDDWRLWWMGSGSSNSGDFGYSDYGLSMTAFSDILFQSWFAANSAILVFATLSQRLRLPFLLICAGLYALITYSLFGRLHWGGGMLSNMGFRDFAGSVSIFVLGGAAAVGAGFAFRFKGGIQPISEPKTIWLLAGVTLLIAPNFFGAGLNTPIKTMFIIEVASGLMAGVICSLILKQNWIKGVSLGALSAIAATAATDHLPLAIAAGVGAIAGALAVIVSKMLEGRIIDPISAISAFGVGGVIGSIIPSLFLSDYQIGVQTLGVGLAAIWAGAVWFVIGFVLPSR